MNRKGFTLIELLGCLMLLGVILCIGLYTTSGTLATALSTLTDVSISEIYNASKSYVLENAVTWYNDGEEYTCVAVRNLVDSGYFSYDDVSSYITNGIKLTREPKTKVISNVDLVSQCN